MQHVHKLFAGVYTTYAQTAQRRRLVSSFHMMLARLVYLLPLGPALFLAGNDAGEPLHRSGSCHPGDNHAQGKAMIC